MNLEFIRPEFRARYHRVALGGASVILVLTTLFFLSRTFIPSLTQMTHSFPAYYTAARLILTGKWDVRVYDDAWFGDRVLELTDGQISERLSMNPPTTSYLLVPLASLDLRNARMVWQVLNLVLLVATLWLLARTLQAGLSIWSILFAAFALVYPPLVENFRVAQVYVLLLFGFTLTFWSETFQHKTLGGISLGLALGIKPGGLPILLLLLVRRSWRAVLVALGTVLALGVLSLIMLGTESWFAFFRRASDYASAPLASHVAYQTVPSFFQHLFVPSAEFNPTPIFNLPVLAPVLTLIVWASVLGSTLWVARHAALDLAFAAVVTLSVILFPLASEYHYTLLLLPLAVMSNRLTRTHTRADLLCLPVILSLLCVPVDWNAPRWKEPAWTFIAYPRLYGGILLWLWFVLKMTRSTRTNDVQEMLLPVPQN